MIGALKQLDARGKAKDVRWALSRHMICGVNWIGRSVSGGRISTPTTRKNRSGDSKSIRPGKYRSQQREEAILALLLFGG